MVSHWTLINNQWVVIKPEWINNQWVVIKPERNWTFSVTNPMVRVIGVWGIKPVILNAEIKIGPALKG